MGQRNVLLSKSGFSLVEVMIALVIALLVFFALMQTALVGIDSNMRNALRDMAVNVADMRMDENRTIAFTTIKSDTSALSGCDCPTGFSSTGSCIQRDVKSISGFDFCSNVTCGEFGGDNNCATDDSDNKQITVTVGWKWKGENYTHRVSTIRKRT